MDNIADAAQVMSDVMSTRVKVDWLDWTLQRIHEDMESQLLDDTFRHKLKR